jgi:hypothetical protein
MTPIVALPLGEGKARPVMGTTYNVVPVTSLDYRRLAERRLPRFLFDYIDGGANDELTLARNVTDFHKITVRQRVLRDVSSIDTSTTLAGEKAAMPLVLAITLAAVTMVGTTLVSVPAAAQQSPKPNPDELRAGRNFIETRVYTEQQDQETLSLFAGLRVADVSDGMDKVGQRFKCNEIYIPEVLIAARAMNQSMEILKPELVKAGVKPIGKMLMGTVKGDLHDIGKNLVKMMAQGAGIEVVDLGIDVSADKYLQGMKDNPDAKAVGLSALLTTTMRLGSRRSSIFRMLCFRVVPRTMLSSITTRLSTPGRTVP